MTLIGNWTPLRKPSRRRHGGRGTRLDEDRVLLLLGLAVLLAISGLSVLAAFTVHARHAALGDATAAGGRLGVNGLDHRLYQDLVNLQQDETLLFQSREDPGQAPPDHDPATDQELIQHDLIMLRVQFSGSARVQDDITVISEELPRYASLEASALTYNQRGLPVGAAYLREAAGYLTGYEQLNSVLPGYMLPTADDVRQVDQAQVSADDATIDAVPWALLAMAVIALACLAGLQVRVAHYTRCQFDPWLLLSTLATMAVVAWPATALSVSLHVVRSYADPHAVTAADLAQARINGLQASGDDLLTQADHDEDCSTAAPSEKYRYYSVTCMFETQVENYLAPDGLLRMDLARTARDAPDRTARALVNSATTAAGNWLAAEKKLPTLQNLADAGKSADTFLRYSPSFNEFVGNYTTTGTSTGTATVYGGVTNDSAAFQEAVTSALGHEWHSYGKLAKEASGVLADTVTAIALFGLLAVAACGAGTGLRVAEYWSAGERS
jgi:hypothetical protein